MQVSVDDAGMTAKVSLNGRLDAMGAETAAARLGPLAEQKHGLVVDMSGVTFLASIGIRQLVVAARTLTRRGGRMVLLNPTKEVGEVLTISAVNDLIPIALSEWDAQAILAAALGR